jgi:hypothetical protein
VGAVVACCFQLLDFDSLVFVLKTVPVATPPKEKIALSVRPTICRELSNGKYFLTSKKKQKSFNGILILKPLPKIFLLNISFEIFNSSNALPFDLFS